MLASETARVAHRDVLRTADKVPNPPRTPQEIRDFELGCARKIRHRSRKAAKAALKRTDYGASLSVYECGFCGGWHTGTDTYRWH